MMENHSVSVLCHFILCYSLSQLSHLEKNQTLTDEVRFLEMQLDIIWNKKLGHQVKLKEDYVHTRGFSFIIIFLKLYHNVCLYDIQDKFKLAHV